jgi:hypothetical protein
LTPARDEHHGDPNSLSQALSLGQALNIQEETMNIVEFLEARLAEDELTATAAIDGTADWHVLYTYRDVKDGEGHYVVLADSRYPTVGQAAHIGRHSPARVLRQCEAVRSVIADLLRLDALGDVPGRSATEASLRQLALAYSDHADFNQAWA